MRGGSHKTKPPRRSIELAAVVASSENKDDDDHDDDETPPPRLLRRPTKRGKQSKWNLEVAGDEAWDCWADVYRDPFHRVMALPVLAVCILFAATYIFCWFAFAPLYMAISEECDLDASSYRSAVYYSIIVMSTIGFGTPDMTFNGCWSACWALSPNACRLLRLSAEPFATRGAATMTPSPTGHKGVGAEVSRTPK